MCLLLRRVCTQGNPLYMGTTGVLLILRCAVQLQHAPWCQLSAWGEQESMHARASDPWLPSSQSNKETPTTVHMCCCDNNNDRHHQLARHTRQNTLKDLGYVFSLGAHGVSPCRPQLSLPRAAVKSAAAQAAHHQHTLRKGQQCRLSTACTASQSTHSSAQATANHQPPRHLQLYTP